MKITIKPMKAIYALSATAILFASCQKSDTLNTSDTSTSQTIAIAASASTSSSVVGSSDSLYLVQPCGHGGKRDSIAQASLPASVSTYLSANYSGYTFAKAFVIKDASATTGYVAVIYYNDKPVGLQFDNTGAFVKVLEQREKGDLDGPGHHNGGRFEHRDGKGRDSIALTALPTAITAYFTAHYSTDTLVKAFKDHDNSIVVLSENNGAFATIFTASGTFVKRETLQSKQGNCQPVELSAIPSAAANYLAQTYPNYVFEKAFVLKQGGTAKGFVVVIDANNTKYAVEFDSTGNFVKAKTIF